ncbi:class I SAM-dependent methyltransferase [Niabella terrae]
MKDSTQRFSDRVSDYIRYRPKYPPEIIGILRDRIGLNPHSIIADIGAGTGFLTELFLKNKNYTYAVEPNDAMRIACGELYGHHANLKLVKGTAETTTLFDHTIDTIVAGQAFHWFDRDGCRQEFNRILKTGGHIVLIWNARRDDHAFSKGYDNLLRELIPEYQTLDHRNVDQAALADFFQPASLETAALPHQQVFDWEGFRGRVLSSSYVPKSGPVYNKIMKGIRQLYEQYAIDNKVIFSYDTQLFWNL